MKKIFPNNSKRTIALILLGVFVFSFLHSELGFLDFDGDNHGAHDYCQIIKNTNTHSKVLREDLPKLERNKDICIHCIDDIKAVDVVITLASTDEHQLFKQSTEAYLFNRTFLI